MSRQAVFTIAPHARFLSTLAERVLDGTLMPDWPRQGPFWLSDVTIIVPTRRARLALAEAFSQRGHALLPDIRTFGGDPADEEPFLPPIDAPVLPTAIDPLERRLVLAQLVAAWAGTPEGRQGFATPPSAAEILAMARSLAELIDDLEVEGIAPQALAGLALEKDLAENWQQTLKFLDIALSHWPDLLTAQGLCDGAARRNARLRRQAMAAPLIYGDRPVIAAGSTGSIVATADLLAAIAALKRGSLVLAGVDTTITPAEHELLLDPLKGGQGHGQYGTAKLLRRLGQRFDTVTELAPHPALRTQVVRHALARADATADWAEARAGLNPEDMAEAFAAVSLIAARTEDEQARAIGLAARAGLAAGQTVGIVTPDRNLARRIAAEMGRYGVEVDDSAGTPLFQSRIGRLVRQGLAVANGGCKPIDLMGLLGNPHVRLGLGRPALRRAAETLELALLRGQRLGPGLAGLRQVLSDNAERRLARTAHRLSPAEAETIAGVLDRLEDAMAPVVALLERGAMLPAALARGLRHMVAGLVAGEGEQTLLGAETFERWLAILEAQPGGLPYGRHDIEGVLYQLMEGFDLRPERPGRSDIAIWGELEARLQNPDLLILAALNEDLWPRTADPGPWLSRSMRIGAGLEPPERQQGQSAHDFEMGLGNGQVILAYAERRGTSPAIVSRLVQRLEAFLGEAVSASLRARGDVWLAAARRLDAPQGKPQPARRPAPNPPADLRPRRLSVTEVETLFRSPYDIYAKYVLGLRPLDPLGEEPGARDRGTLIHQVFARAIADRLDLTHPDAPAQLDALAREAFAVLDTIAERRDIWLRRFATAARQFLDFESERSHVAGRNAEIDGEWLFPALDGFKLVGRADRVDLCADGTLEILDFKTGALPRTASMTNFEAPQLLLEAAMAAQGGLKAMAPAKASGLAYIKIGLGPEAFTVSPFKLAEGHTLQSAADEAGRRLQRHVAAFLLTQRPMAAAILPDPNRNFAGPYTHLARTQEWTLHEGEA